MILSTDRHVARTAFDKAPASVCQSRIYAQAGDAEEALRCLLQCLRDLDVTFDEKPTWEQCDIEFERLSVRIQSLDRAEIVSPAPPDADDPSLASIGAVLAEAISAAWWSDSLMFYQLSIVMVDVYLTRGPFPSSGMAFLHLAKVALSRFSMAELAIELGSVCLDLLDKYRDAFSMARGYMLYASFIGHIHYPLNVAVSQVEAAVEYAT